MNYKYWVLILFLFGSIASTYADDLSSEPNSPFDGTIFDKKIWRMDTQSKALSDESLDLKKDELNLNYDNVDILGNANLDKKIDYRVTNIPPLNHNKVAGEIVTGALGSVLFFVGGALIRPCDESDGFDCLGDKLLTGIIASPIGAAAGTYLIGNTNKETGSFAKTLLGSSLGLVLGAALAAGTQNGVVAALIPLSMGVGSTIGFNSSRTYKNPQKSKAIMFKVIDHKF